MSHEHEPDDKTFHLPDEWPEAEQREVTIALDVHQFHMVQVAAMKVSLEHAFHKCDVEKTADDLLDKLNDAVDAQIHGL